MSKEIYEKIYKEIYKDPYAKSEVPSVVITDVTITDQTVATQTAPGGIATAATFDGITITPASQTIVDGGSGVFDATPDSTHTINGTSGKRAFTFVGLANPLFSVTEDSLGIKQLAGTTAGKATVEFNNSGTEYTATTADTIVNVSPSDTITFIIVAKAGHRVDKTTLTYTVKDSPVKS